MYVLDADTGQAHWASIDPTLDEWTGRFLADGQLRTTDDLFGDGGSETLRASPAPVAHLPPPRLELIAAEGAGDVATLRLRLAPARAVDRAYVYPAAGARLLAVGLGGAPPEPIQGDGLLLVGLPAGGLELSLRLVTTGPIQLTVVDQSAGLPDLPGLPRRPDTVMSSPNPEPLRGYPTSVRATFALPRPG
jgi:hypothetical protein